MRGWILMVWLCWVSGAGAQVLLSELMFDPPPGGADYIELFNAGTAAVDISGWRLGNGRSAPRVLVRGSYNLSPGGYVAVTADTAWVRFRYGGQGGLLQVEALPSYPNERGLVQLLDGSGVVVDAVAYHVDWHHVLVRDPEGVALERVSFVLPSGDSLNWTSAAWQNGVYGSPGFVNGQAGLVVERRDVWLEQRGQQVLLHYRFPVRGRVMNVSVYDVVGTWSLTCCAMAYAGRRVCWPGMVVVKEGESCRLAAIYGWWKVSIPPVRAGFGAKRWV